MKFGKYTAEKKLGKGAMGEVYYGIHPNLDIPIAIKTLSKALVEDELFVERFIREAKMAARIKHENAIMIYDADNDDENYFIVMEYVSGGDLGELLKNEGALPENKALEITRCIASALKAASKFGIIHRDIKPENIMLTETGVPKLADLGIARQNVEGAVNTTVTGVIVGTPAYLAPEQAQDSKSVDARADLYSLGCTLYHMLCNKYPFSADNPLAMLMKHVNEDVPDIRVDNPEVSDQTAELLKKLMAKDPNDRPQSAEELISIIDKQQKGVGSSQPLKENVNSPVDNSFMVSKRAFLLTAALVLLIAGLAVTVAVLPGNKGVDNSLAETDSIKAGNSEETQLDQSLKIEDLGIEMLWVEPGSYMMGAGEGEPQTAADETLHSVTLSQGFYLSKLEVSVAAWKEFVSARSYQSQSEERGWSSFYEANGNWNSRSENRNWTNIGLEDDDAISMVTWNDCVEFCRWLTERERRQGRLPDGFEYTLPTEAQWEYACRAGSQSVFANDMNYDELGWVRENSNMRVWKRGLKKPNAWGFYDMHGNVWEFCLDRSEGQDYFDVSNNVYRNGITDPLSTLGSRVTYRGGSFPDAAMQYCRSASRGHSLPSYSCNNHGFRLCLSRVRN